MANFKILLKKNIVEMVRNKRIVIFSVIFATLSVISALTAKYLPVLLKLLLTGLDENGLGTLLIFEANVANSYMQYISNFGEIGILVVGVLFVGAIVKEKSKGTYASLKMNGVKDCEIVFSHLVSQILLITVSYLISVALFVVLNIILFKQIMGVRGLVTLVYIYLLLLVTVCFSLFVSCLCKKSGKAYLFVILSYFGIGLIEVFPRINRINPFHLLTLSNNLMYTLEYSLSEHLLTALSSLAFCVVFVIISLFIVKNKINNKKVDDNDYRERI